VEKLRIATLAYSQRNVAELCALLDAGKVKSLGLLCSQFFKDHSKADYARTACELLGRGQRLAASRNHAKVVTFLFADGCAYSLEGSANLRSNSNREQFCLVNDRGLHDWHSRWIDEALARHGEVHEG